MSNPLLKRKFTPVQNSCFNPSKKLKRLQSSTQESFTSSSSTSSSSFSFTPTIPQPFNLKTEERSQKSSSSRNQDIEMLGVDSRPKFKARPMPKYPEPKDFSKTSGLPVDLEKQRKNPLFSDENCKSSSRSFRDFSTRFSKPETISTFSNSGQRPRSCHFNESPFFKSEGLFDLTSESSSSLINFEGFQSFPPSQTFHSLQRSQSSQSPSSSSSFQNMKNTKFQNFLENRQKNEEKNKEFKFVARPMPNFNNVFVPVTNFEPTQPVSFELSTEKRAVEREKFESFVKDKENLMNELKIQQAILEAEELKNYRKTLEFKAKPLQDLRPFMVKRSQEELTRPRSPVLMTKTRALFKDLENEDKMDLD